MNVIFPKAIFIANIGAVLLKLLKTGHIFDLFKIDIYYYINILQVINVTN